MEQPDKWIEIASKNGYAVLALMAIGYIFYKKIWPLVERTWERAWALIEKRLSDADAREKENQRLWKEQGELFAATLQQDRESNESRFEEMGKLFTEALRTQNVFAAETHKEQMRATNQIIDEVKTLNQQIRNGNGK